MSPPGTGAVPPPGTVAPPEVARHHRRRRVRAGAVLGALVVAVLVVVLGGAATGTRLNADQRLREFVITGEMGKPVSTREFEVTVLSVQTAVEIDADGLVHDTAGIWVLVSLHASAVHQPTSIAYTAVRDTSGRSWLAATRVRQPFPRGGHRLEPGIAVEVDVVFELPPEAATDLTLRVGQRRDPVLDAVVEVGLPVDADRIDLIVAASEAAAISEAETGSETDAEPDSELPPEPALEPVPVRLTPRPALAESVVSKIALRSRR